jgi:hypothetical protein
MAGRRGYHGPERRFAPGNGLEVKQIIVALLEIATLRRGPEDLPASQFFLGLMVLLYVATGVISISLYSDDPGDLVAQLLLDLGLLLAFFGLLLSLFRRLRRLTQTLAAVMGASALLACFALPLSLLLRGSAPGDSGALIPALGIYLIVLWSISINGHILQRALEIPYVGGVLLAAGYFVLNYMAFARFFPAEI